MSGKDNGALERILEDEVSYWIVFVAPRSINWTDRRGPIQHGGEQLFPRSKRRAGLTGRLGEASHLARDLRIRHSACYLQSRLCFAIQTPIWYSLPDVSLL
jgi:hypothetical protein